HDYLVFYKYRRAVYVAATFLDVFDFDVPDFLTGLGVERDYVIVHRSEEDHSVADGQTPIELSVRREKISRDFVVVGPESLAGFGIDPEDSILARDQIHDSVDDQRSCVEAALYFAGLKCPHRNQTSDV